MMAEEVSDMLAPYKVVDEVSDGMDVERESSA